MLFFGPTQQEQLQQHNPPSACDKSIDKDTVRIGSLEKKKRVWRQSAAANYLFQFGEKKKKINPAVWERNN